MNHTLLVIGNGFDKYCGLKSSFSDYIGSAYYQSTRDLVKRIYDWVSKNRIIGYEGTFTDISGITDTLRKITFWDLYFALPVIEKSSKINLWYDFEKRMNTLLDPLNGASDFNRIRSAWKYWYESIEQRDESCNYSLTLNFYLWIRTNQQCIHQDISRKEAELVLFSDLKEYEKRFGNYICLIQKENEYYPKNAWTLIGTLVDEKRDDLLSCVNTFNYSDLSGIVLGIPVWHINGETSCPIFGVDYKNIDAKNTLYKFTKTYRRMELDEQEHPKCQPTMNMFSKVVVFGHSLNEQDYNYFFALFNELGIRHESVKSGKYVIEFVYSSHSEKSPVEIRESIIENVSSLFQIYSKDILHEDSCRLLDILHLTGTIKYRLIPTAKELFS